MPWIPTWIDAEKNESLPVLEELPEGIAERPHFSMLREAWGTTGGVFRKFHYCRHCKGWIEGEPTSHEESTLGLLSGRQGRVDYCRRCGEEISFMGVVS